MTLEPPPGPAGVALAHVRAIDDVLAHYGWTRAGEPSPIPDSVLNHNYRVDTDAGPRFVRVHKKTRTRERIELEHRVIGFAAEQGIPVNPPLPDGRGRTVHSSGGALVAVFPWQEHRTLRRGAIDETGAALLGDVHGRIHAAMAEFDDPALVSGKTGSSWDTEEAALALSRVDDLIRYYPAVSEEWVRIQAEIRFQLAILESAEARPDTDFAALPTQPVHGDFHERNVLLAPNGDAVVAVVDWEMASRMPPVFELIRAADFTGVLAEPLMGAYLSAYAANGTVSPADVAQGVEMWWQSCLHDTWAYAARFVQGDDRVTRFLNETGARVRRLASAAYREWLAGSIRRLLA
jgi:Ser/Thr protein kinase RdoA (MazF antagonist)